MRVVGLDLAWGQKASTGLTVLDDCGELVHLETVRTDEEILSRLDTWASDDCIVAIDAPLVVKNASGMRLCERLVGRYFNRYGIGCHASNLANPAFADGGRAARLAAALELDVSPASASSRRAIEVYPHTAIVQLFGLPRALLYKHKPGRDLPLLRAEQWKLIEHVESLADRDPAMTVAHHSGWQQVRRSVETASRKADLKAVEDSVDAVVCAYVGLLAYREPSRIRVIGDSEGYIVTPVDDSMAQRIDSDQAALRPTSSPISVQTRQVPDFEENIESRLPTYEDVIAAAKRLEGVAHRTPVLRSRLIDEQLGAEVVFKCENFQRIGAFKFRGAYNALSQFSPEQRRAGVITYSSGNHAQAIALAAQLLEIPATIVMPHDAPSAKVAATAGYGATIVRYDRYTEDREQVGRELGKRHGLTLIPPYDHHDVIAGQGTAVKELLEDVGDLDALFIPLGGGGLLSGSLLSVGALSPQTAVYGVEPEEGNDAQRSLREGRIVHIDTPQTIADGAQTQHLGELTFAILQRSGPTILTATDPELVDAMRAFVTFMKIVVEPTGALGLAALKRMASQLQGRRVGVLISGGNVDPARLGALLSAG